MMDQWRLLVLVFCIATSFLLEVQADCCDRDGIWCCGNGPCNIFCCNCDNGCNKGCESCGWGEWIKCAGVLAKCTLKCLPPGTGCKECLGDMYDKCLPCLGIHPPDSVGRSAPVTRVPRLEFFNSLDKDSSGGISKEEFEDFKLASTPPIASNPERSSHDECWEHSGWDTDGDGQIDFEEFNTSRCMRQQPAPTARSGAANDPSPARSAVTGRGPHCASGHPAVVVNVGCPAP